MAVSEPKIGPPAIVAGKGLKGGLLKRSQISKAVSKIVAVDRIKPASPGQYVYRFTLKNGQFVFARLKEDPAGGLDKVTLEKHGAARPTKRKAAAKKRASRRAAA